jgi:hypothetical protein
MLVKLTPPIFSYLFSESRCRHEKRRGDVTNDPNSRGTTFRTGSKVEQNCGRWGKRKAYAVKCSYNEVCYNRLNVCT